MLNFYLLSIYSPIRQSPNAISCSILFLIMLLSNPPKGVLILFQSIYYGKKKQARKYNFSFPQSTGGGTYKYTYIHKFLNT